MALEIIGQDRARPLAATGRRIAATNGLGSPGGNRNMSTSTKCCRFS